MSPLRELLDCFDADDIGDAVLLLLAIAGITAMFAGWI